MIYLRKRMVLKLTLDLTAAGLHYVTDVSEDWCRVSLQVPQRQSFALVSSDSHF
jgi:hypothetical protein